MIVRLAETSDKKQVFSLLDELVSEVSRVIGQAKPFTDNSTREKFFEEIIKRNDIKVFVIEENGKILGLADLFIIPIMRRGYYQGNIEDFIITENNRGRGIGSKLLNEIKKFCKNNNIKVIKITSSLKLKEAHNFYLKNGGEFTEKLFRFELS